MELINYELQIPKGMKDYLTTEDVVVVQQRNALLIYPAIRNQTISYGRAAEILGMNKYDLIDMYEEMGIPYYDMDFSEVEEDIETFHKLEGMFV